MYPKIPVCKGGNRMNGCYRHEATGNYLVLDGEKMLGATDYRVMIFRKNKLKRFLKLRVNYIDNIPEYQYEISSKQSLKQFFECRKITYHDMKTIIIGIKEAADELDSYLLSTENMILEPDYIYVDPITKIPEFCYHPENNIGIEEGIRELFRYFLNIIDSSDKETVEFAYGIYCKAMQQNFTIDTILEFHVSQIMDMENVMEISEKEVIKKEEQKSLLEKLKESLFHLLRGKKINQEIHEMEEKGCEITDSYVDYSGDTMLLENERCDYRLISEDRNEVIELWQFPYIVGKIKEHVDFIIHSENVSRIHAKFLKEQNEIFILDMNSTNGTFINGIRMESYDRIKLNSGDRVRFADIEYIYQQFH